MPKQTLDYRGPVKRANDPADSPIANRRSAVLAAIVTAVVLLTNLVLVTEAATDKSWGALQIMIVIGPITNGILCAVSFAFTPLVKRFTGGALTLHIVASLLPIAAIVADAFMILSMGVHGC